MGRPVQILAFVMVVASIIFVVAVTLFSSLQSKISKRLEQGEVLPPLELHSQGLTLIVERRFPLQNLQRELEHEDLHAERDYFLGDISLCQPSAIQFKLESKQCLWLKSNWGRALIVTWDENLFTTEIWQKPAGDNAVAWSAIASTGLFPRLVTEFYGNQPILKTKTQLAQVPLACLQAVTAIEDRDFLEHSGVSASGILRAIIRNIKAGSFAEGGSTITQQLVKNFFLTPKKTIRRKVEEQLLALILEAQLSKDQILEMYLNVIYMGQSGSYQVLGLSSAAQHYFDKSITNLSLSECALLAATINNPGRYSPFAHPDQATSRRDLVLNKMVENKMIGEAEAAAAKAMPLPKSVAAERRPSAPYFVMGALREFKTLEIESDEGARLYTTLDPEIQILMTAAVQKQLPEVEKRIRKPSPQPLQVAMITVDVHSGRVLGMIGGRDFRSTQYNRAVDSRRQIGSIIKPFVYWPALADHDPMTAVLDEPFQWKTGRQVWKPKNYDGKFRGPVPYFYALANSLNIPAARVGQEVGLDSVAKVLLKSGVHVEIPNLPSLTLGALELSPIEVIQGYFTLSRFGVSDYVHTLTRVENPHGEALLTEEAGSDAILDPAQTAVLVGMMKQTLDLGTGRSARAYGLTGTYAGKTGSTSDSKDAWFVGFDSHLLSLVWVGYDDNTAMGLTGASAALPIWTEFMKSARVLYREADFHWPEGVELKTISKDEVLKNFQGASDLPDNIQLIFKK